MILLCRGNTQSTKLNRMAFQWKESLRGASSWKPCAFQWRSCSLQLLLSWALGKPISVTAHSLTLLLSSTAPFKHQFPDHLPSSTNCQEQLLSYTTISPRSRSWNISSFSLVKDQCLPCPSTLPRAPLCHWRIDSSTFTCWGTERGKSRAGKVLNAQVCQTQAFYA